MFRKPVKSLLVIVFAAFAIFGMAQQSVVTSTPANAQVADTYDLLNLFGEIFERIRADYVDEHTDAELIDAAIDGMLKILDPNSQYLNAEEYRGLTEGISGQFGGLGMEVTMEDGVVRVVTPIDDTPAAAAGVQAGDVILAIDGQSIEGMALDAAVDLMRGPPGTEVTITFRREGIQDPFDVVLERAIIQSPQVRSQIFDDIIYLRLTVFGPQTFDQFASALAEDVATVGADNVRGFIIDLRNNGGGALTTAVEMTDAFLNRGEIVSIRGRVPEQTQRYFAENGDLTMGLPVIVLVNGGSASASEILAGALQDHHRATIVGSQSFGKGTVQTIFTLGPDLGAIRLTTGRYYTPSGRSIHGVGITPDIAVEQPIPPSIMAQLTPEDIPVDEDGNPITDFDIIFQVDEDTQLQYALRLMRGEETNPAFPPPPENAP
jgi:carboxyl-terminal processing protease